MLESIVTASTMQELIQNIQYVFGGIGIILLFIILVIVFLPSVIAFVKRINYKWAIFILNILLPVTAHISLGLFPIVWGLLMIAVLLGKAKTR